MKQYHLSFLLIVFAFASSTLAQSLFVPARYSNEVAVINTSTNQVLTQIPVGNFPIRIAMTPDRLKAFVSDAMSGSISVLDTVARTNTATIPVARVPGESAITPDGRRLFVLHQHGTGIPNQCPVEVIDTATNVIITTVIIPGHWAKDILFTPDGRFAYIANFSNNTVDIIDTTTYQVTSIPVGGGPRRLCISPAADRVYVTNYNTGSVSAIDTATQQLIATIPVGLSPEGIAITPNGQEVYSGNLRTDDVSVINTTTLTVVATIHTGDRPQRVVFSNDGSEAFVTNAGTSNNVSVINTATHAVINTLPVGNNPFVMLVSQDGTKVYVTNSGDTTISVIDVPSLTVSATIANVGSAPFDLAFGPNGAPTPTPSPTASPTPSPTPTPTATPTATPGPIQLTGRAIRNQGINISRLGWRGATSVNVDIYRDGNLLVTTANDGAYDDSTGTSGQASFVYQVCEAGTQTCSNTVTVSFGP
jgi:YVTN family beta-propeller protein